MQIENTLKSIVIAGGKNIQPTKKNQQQVNAYRQPVNTIQNIYFTAHFLCNKSVSSNLFSIQGLVMVSVRYVSIIRLAMGAA